MADRNKVEVFELGQIIRTKNFSSLYIFMRPEDVKLWSSGATGRYNNLLPENLFVRLYVSDFPNLKGKIVASWLSVEQMATEDWEFTTGDEIAVASMLDEKVMSEYHRIKAIYLEENEVS